MSGSTTSATIVYDGDGNRVSKTVGGVTTYYLVDDLNPTGYPQVVDELNSSGAVTRSYTYGLQRIDEQQQISGSWTPSFYGYDGGGNVRQLTNTSGTVTDSYEYDAYGNEFTVSGSTPNEFMYRGEQFDSDLGLYYLRARYYNPATGRFMSRDPEGGKRGDPESLHKYLYADGDPINGIDPLGRMELFDTARILAVDAAKTFVLTRIAASTVLLIECAALSLYEIAQKARRKEDGIPWQVDLGCWAIGVPGLVQGAIELRALAGLE
jgi:RHS repeat-associated protein